MKQHLTKTMLKKLTLMAAALSIAGPASALNILLTNDDGYGSYGNNAVKTALEAAGHTVYVSTPATDQSGKSGAINTASGQAVLFTTYVADKEWAINGTPVDSVSAALYGLLPSVLAAGEKIDLVISGINKGDNVSTSTNASGTVGAAMFALRQEIPSIAVSVGHDYAGITALRAAMASGNTAAIPGIQAAILANDQAGADTAAALVVDIVAILESNGLPDSLGLNVNVPSGAIDSKGVRITRSGNSEAFKLLIQSNGAGGLVLKSKVDSYLAAAYAGSPVPPEVFTPDLNEEGQAFAYGYSTIAIFNGNYDASELTTLGAWQLACQLKSIAAVEIFWCGKKK